MESQRIAFLLLLFGFLVNSQPLFIQQCPFESSCTNSPLTFPELPYISKNDFQFISIGDFDNSHVTGDIEGRVFVGGSLNTGPGFSIGSNIPFIPGYSIDTALVVGKNGIYPTGLIDGEIQS